MSDLDAKAWHEWRRGGVGASDISALLGLSNYASPTSLFFEKVGALDDDREDSARQRIGKRMEAVLAAEFHDETGLYVGGQQTWCSHPLYPWARCTVDGFVFESDQSTHDVDNAISTIEFKTDGRFGFDEIPANIRAQCVWQMGVTGMRDCYLVVMFSGFRVETFRVEWDESDWMFMLAKGREFWDCVEQQTPPPVDDHWATTEALTNVYRDPDGMLDADDTARETVAAVQRAMAITAAAEATEKRVKNELRALLGDKTDLVDGEKPAKKKDAPPVPNVIATWRPSTRTTFDHKAALANHPTLEKYNRVTDVRTLRVQAVQS